MKIMMIFICAALLGACATVPVPLAARYSSQVQPAPKPDRALVYFYNETHLRFTLTTSQTMPGEPYAVHEGGESGPVIATLGRSCVNCDNRTYTWAYLPPGVHQFTALFRNGHGTGVDLSVILNAGQTYYFRISQEPAWWSPTITIEPVAREDALRGLPSFMDCHSGGCG